jgi:hypothetical protein
METCGHIADDGNVVIRCRENVTSHVALYYREKKYYVLKLLEKYFIHKLTALMFLQPMWGGGGSRVSGNIYNTAFEVAMTCNVACVNF